MSASAHGERIGYFSERNSAYSAPQHIYYGFYAFIGVVIVGGTIPFLVKSRHLVGKQPEYENIFVAHSLVDFHVGSVHGAYGHGAVYHKFHIAGAAGFLARYGNLFADVACRHYYFGKGYPVVFQKYHFYLVFHRRVVVDDVRHYADKTNDLLSHIITARRLRSEDKRPRHYVHIGVRLQFVIQLQNVQSVQKLTFVFVQPLDLHVENTVGVHGHAVGFLDIFGKLYLVLLLDCEKFVHRRFIVLEFGKFLQNRRVSQPSCSDFVVYEGRQSGVGFGYPTPVRDAVGHVGELLGSYLIVIGKHRLFKDIAVKLADAVYGMARRKTEISHSDNSVAHYGVGGYLVPLVGINFPKFCAIYGEAGS